MGIAWSMHVASLCMLIPRDKQVRDVVYVFSKIFILSCIILQSSSLYDYCENDSIFIIMILTYVSFYANQILIVLDLT
jgi:hypothetical protein